MSRKYALNFLRALRTPDVPQDALVEPLYALIRANEEQRKRIKALETETVNLRASNVTLHSVLECHGWVSACSGELGGTSGPTR
tara:strand:- start:504 stop:755 length:252 start_codon:yes stop_codon:yes gene_type:complete